MRDAYDDDVPVLTEEEYHLPDVLDGSTGEPPSASSAEQQATRWFRVSVVLILALMGSVAWHHVDKMEVVEPYVLTVQIRDGGHVTLVEPPKPMREYVFQPEAIMGMVRDFVVDLRALGEDPTQNTDRQQDVKAAVCGPATQQILRPPLRQAALVAVNVTSFGPTESPQTYRVSWSETWHDKLGNPLSEHTLVADVTVRRRDIDWSKRDSLAIWLRHPMSLCVSSYVINEYPQLPTGGGAR